MIVDRCNPTSRYKRPHRVVPRMEMMVVCRHGPHIDRDLYGIIDAIPIEECASATGYCL